MQHIWNLACNRNAMQKTRWRRKISSVAFEAAIRKRSSVLWQNPQTRPEKSLFNFSCRIMLESFVCTQMENNRRGWGGSGIRAKLQKCFEKFPPKLHLDVSLFTSFNVYSLQTSSELEIPFCTFKLPSLMSLLFFDESIELHSQQLHRRFPLEINFYSSSTVEPQRVFSNCSIVSISDPIACSLIVLNVLKLIRLTQSASGLGVRTKAKLTAAWTECEGRGNVCAASDGVAVITE